MADLLIHDPVTGAILRRVQCPDAHAASQSGDGEGQITAPPDFTGDDTTHRIVDGVPTLIA